jgi:hypothetical protein
MSSEQPGQRQRIVWTATTVNHGPRFLYPTAHLRKGAAGNALFTQFPVDHLCNLAISDELGSFEAFLTFGVLEKAQALGDGQALREARRHFIRFLLGADLVGRTERLPEEFS